MKIEFESIDEYLDFIRKLPAQPAQTTNFYLNLKNENKKLWEKIEELSEQVGLLMPKNKSEKPPKRYRKYSPSIQNPAQIKDVDKTGALYTVRGKAKYTIYDLLKLKKYIPQTEKYPTFKSLAEVTGINVSTVTRLSLGIEDNYYDHIFKKWSKLQSEPLQRKKFVENNPEKRKALMGMG